MYLQRVCADSDELSLVRSDEIDVGSTAEYRVVIHNVIRNAFICSSFMVESKDRYGKLNDRIYSSK